MKKRLIPFCVAAALAVGACGGSGEKDAEGFPPAKPLTADSVAIEQILTVRDMVLCGGYVVIHSPKTSKVIFRYRLPEWTFVDSSLVKGSGPDDIPLEFYMLNTYPKRDILWASTGNTQMLLKYGVEDEAIRRLSTTYLPKRSFFTQGNVWQDSLLLFSRVNYEQAKEYLFTCSLDADTARKVDSVLCLTKAEVKSFGSGKSAMLYNSPQALVQGDRVLLWYPKTENMAVYRIGSDGRLHDERVYGDSLSFEDLQQIDFKNLKRNDYSSLLAVTDDRVYIRYLVYDKPLSEGTKENPAKLLRSEVRVYDWQYRPVVKYELDHPEATKLYADPDHHRFYAYDPQLDFEQVYVYDYAR